MTTEIWKDQKPRMNVLAVIIVCVVVALLGWAYDALFGHYPLQQARSPDGRYVASILCDHFDTTDYLGLEISGFHPFGLGREVWFGYPDVHFLHSKLTWRDNHTLIITHVIGPSGEEDDQNPSENTWRDVKVIVK